jgi:ankyrin repeat protein
LFYLLRQKGNTALMLAAGAGKAEVVQVLLAAGAVVNMQNKVSIADMDK